MPMRYACRIRWRRTLLELCELISPRLEWPAFEVMGHVASLFGSGFQVTLNWQPVDVTRELRGNVSCNLISDDVPLMMGFQDVLHTLDEEVRYRFCDTYHLRSQHGLQPFCDTLKEHFDLSAFLHDGENENEWAISEDAVKVVHVSHAYDDDTYHRWNPAHCPPGCNYSLDIKVKARAPAEMDDTWRRREWRPAWIRTLVSLGDRRVYLDDAWHM